MRETSIHKLIRTTHVESEMTFRYLYVEATIIKTL